MKRVVLAFLAMFFLCSVGSAMASTITFDEATLYSTDPTIGKVSFSAGAGSAFNDTFVADFWTPGNPYLMSGIDDGTGQGGGFNSYFVAAALSGGSTFKSVKLDLAVEEVLPGSPVEIFYFFKKGGSFTGNLAYLSDTNYHTLTLDNLAGFDTFGISSLNMFDPSAGYSAFHIDNFSYTEASTVPEPSTMLLLSLGIAGCAVWRRKKG